LESPWRPCPQWLAATAVGRVLVRIAGPLDLAPPTAASAPQDNA